MSYICNFVYGRIFMYYNIFNISIRIINYIYICSSSNSIYLYTKINIIFYNVFYCLSYSLQVCVPG